MRVKNSIKGLQIDSGWCEKLVIVKEEIRNKFCTRFYNQSRVKILLDNIDFLIISEADSVSLTKELTEEVKGVVWECDGSKSSGLDGYNLNFIKMS